MESSGTVSEGKLGLLVIDDDIDILNLASHQLKDLYEVYTAENILQAMDLLKRKEICITLCDERLNSESGSELLANIKEQYPDIVRILISGYTDTNSIMNAINKANIFKFIIKPWGNQLKIILEEAEEYYRSNKKNQYNDSLTSLKSEHTILDTLHAEIKRSFRYGTSLSTVLISIANPKTESELHAFLVDRFLLKRIADILAFELRESDFAGRLKDNKFLVLLTETGQGGAAVFINRFMTQIDQFEKKINKGLLPYKVITSINTLEKKQSIEVNELIDLLYSGLEK